MNARIVLPGTHHFARRMRFDVFIGQNFIPSKILSSHITSCNFIYNANGIFKSWEFNCSRPSAGNKHSILTLSVVLPGACVHVLLPGTQRNDLNNFTMY